VFVRYGLKNAKIKELLFYIFNKKMLRINTGPGGFITNFCINSPSNGDLIKYDQSNDLWVNFSAAYLSGVNHDSTLTGNGGDVPLSVASPWNGVSTDSSLTGDGKTTALSVAKPWNGVSTDSTLTGNGDTTPLSVTSPWNGVTRDSSLTGDGKTTPLSVSSVWGGVTTDSTLSGNGRTTPLSVTSPWNGALTDSTLSGDGKSVALAVTSPWGGVTTDATLTGNGKTSSLSVSSPWSGVSTDATLTGNGKTTALAVASPWTGVSTDGTLSGDGKTTPLSVVGAGVFINNTLTGNGLSGNPLGTYVNANYSCYFNQSQSIPSGTETTLLANNLTSGFRSSFGTPAMLTTTSGTITFQRTGLYQLSFTCGYSSNSTGSRTTRCYMNTAFGSNILFFQAYDANASSSGGTIQTASCAQYFLAGESCLFRCTQNSGSSLTATASIAVVLVTNFL